MNLHSIWIIRAIAGPRLIVDHIPKQLLLRSQQLLARAGRACATQIMAVHSMPKREIKACIRMQS